jgi:hypothetical protein
LAYQVFTIVGLSAASVLARALSQIEESERWDEESKKLKQACLHHPEFAMHDHRGFIKRRDLQGKTQEKIFPLKAANLPDQAQLAMDQDHFLNPDTGSALPIALGLVAPDSTIAQATMEQLETLWNQQWQDGGYGRYHASSEPDSAGGWPFASLFIARAYAEMGDHDKIWRILRWLEKAPGALAGSWFEFYGDRIAPPYPQVGITPWTWGEMIVFMVHHLLGVIPEERFLRIKPRLIRGLSRVTASLPVRNGRLNLKLKQDTVSQPCFETAAEVLDRTFDEIRLDYFKGDLCVEVTLPPS